MNEKLAALKRAIKERKILPSKGVLDELFDQADEGARERVILELIEELQHGHVKNVIRFPRAAEG